MSANIIIALILVVVAFVVLFLMSRNEKKKNTLSSSDYKDTPKKNLNNTKLEDLRMPYLVETMKHNELAKAYEVIYDTFSFLDYPNKSNDEIMNKEWHSWQISILLKYLAKKAIFIKPNYNEIIPINIKEFSDTKLKKELQLIINRYKSTVDITREKDKLCDEVVWSARDVAVILMSIIKIGKSNLK